MEIINYKITKLKPAEYNPRKIDKEAMEQLKRSLDGFDCVEPAVVNINPDRMNIIVGGHQRIKAAKALKWKEFPCVEVNLSLEREKELNVRLNKNTGEFDFTMLESNFEMDDLLDWGFHSDDFGFEEEEEFDEVDGEDSVPEIPEVPITKRGDVWLLGDHRLMCGDSVSQADIEKLMIGKKADMIFTDPPYLMGFTGNVHGDGSKSFNTKHGAIKNDKMSRKDGDKFINDIFEVIKNNVTGAFYVCFYRLGLDYIYRALDNNKMPCKSLIIWNKGNHTLSNSDYMSKYEPIAYGWVEDHKFYGAKGSFDIWDISRTQKNDLHPTMKPVELVQTAILNSSQSGELVLDLFGGSGSTLIACEKTGRTNYMMELDEKYCDVIIKRWEEFTGLEALKESD